MNVCMSVCLSYLPTEGFSCTKSGRAGFLEREGQHNGNMVTHNTPSEKLLVEHQWKRQIHNDIVVCSQSTDQSYQVKVFGIIFIQYSSLRVER